MKIDQNCQDNGTLIVSEIGSLMTQNYGSIHIHGGSIIIKGLLSADNQELLFEEVCKVFFF